MSRTWPRIIFLWLCGVLAAAQLTKVSILAPSLREDFDLSLPATGWLVSMLEVGGAALGLAVGILLPLVGAKRALIGGLATLAAAGLGLAIAPTTLTLFGARAAEGLAYVFIVVAAPTLIASIAGDARRSTALTLWSTFVPAGAAVGAVVTSVLAETFDRATALTAWAFAAAAVAAAFVAVPMAKMPSGRLSSARRIVVPNAPAWAATLGFGFYTAVVCALTGLLPLYLVEQHGSDLANAAVIAAIVGLGALPSSLVLFALVHRGLVNPDLSARITVPTLLAASAAMPFVFLPLERPSWTSIGALAFLGLTLAAVTRPLVFTNLPKLSGGTTMNDPKIASANGLLTQFGAGGALIGPPLGGVIVERWGWTALGPALSFGLLAVMLLQLLSERMTRDSSASLKRSTQPTHNKSTTECKS